MLQQLCLEHPLGYTPRIVWKSYRVSAGMAYYKTGVIGLSRTVIDDEQKLHDTLVHEYAHLLAYKRCGKAGAGHGEPWQQAMRELGLQPKVYHSYPVQRNATRQQVAYQCTRCGTTLLRSRRLPKRRKYVHANCGGPIKYAWTKAVMPAAHSA